MAFNISSISNGKAQALQPNSLTALLASLSSAGIFFGLAFASFLFICSWPQLAVIIHPRKSLFLGASAEPLRRNLLRSLYTLLREPDSTLVHDCGIEAALFLHYLWSLFVLFGCAALFIAPCIACFNYYSTSQPSSNDRLNMLSWSNLPAKGVKLYWLYAMLSPVTVALILYLTSRNLAQAVKFRRTAFATELRAPNHPSSREYFVVVKSVPRDWGTVEIQEYYAPWKDHTLHVRPVSVSLVTAKILAQMKSLVQHIEHRETEFINEMIQHSQDMAIAEFQRYLLGRIRERYAQASYVVMHSWRRNSTPISTLYKRLEELTLLLQAEHPQPSSSFVSVLIILNNYHMARAIENHPQSINPFQCRANFLGSVASDIIYSNIDNAWSRTEIRRSLMRMLTLVLIILWVFPMAAVGGLSQASVVLQLTSGWSGLQIPDWLLGVIQGVLPSLATSLLMSLFLQLERILMQGAKYPTNTETQLSTQKNCLFFFYITLFLTPSIASGLVPTAFEILNKGITEIPRVLAMNLPLAGNYYLSYLLTQGMLLAASTLLRPRALVQLYWISKPGLTPRTKFKAMNSLLYPVRWGEIYPFYSILAVIATTYSLLTPFILIIAAITFGIAYVCFRYILLHLSDIEGDTQGRLYFHALFTSFLGVYTGQVTLIGLFILKFDDRDKAHGLGQLMVLLATLLACTQYHIRLKRLYGPLIQHQEGLTNEIVHTETSREELRRLSPVAGPSDRYDLESHEKSRNSFDLTIWLPRDGLGISRSLINEVRSTCFSNSAAAIQITDSIAYVTNAGQIIFQDGKNGGNDLLDSQKYKPHGYVSGED